MISYPCVSNLSLPMRKESNEEEQQQLAQVYLMRKAWNQTTRYYIASENKQDYYYLLLANRDLFLQNDMDKVIAVSSLERIIHPYQYPPIVCTIYFVYSCLQRNPLLFFKSLLYQFFFWLLLCSNQECAIFIFLSLNFFCFRLQKRQ